MSNTSVGSVYQKIIQDVGETSRVDFEESGVDESVLEDLTKIWQKKLSSMGVAIFPWDPKPEPIPSPSSVSSTNYQPQTAAPAPQQQRQSQIASYSAPAPLSNHHLNGGVPIKQEPGLEGPSNYQIPAAFNSAQNAKERAALNLQHTYGQRAAESIRAIQSTATLQQQRPMHMQMPMSHPGQQMQNNQQVHNHQQQQHQNQRTNMQPNVQQAQPAMDYRRSSVQPQAAQLSKSNGSAGGQTDGAGDTQPGTIGMISGMNAEGEQAEMGRIEIDHMIRRRIEEMGQSMEGGGLMRPVDRHVPSKRSKNRRPDRCTASAVTLGAPLPSQYDGPDDDDIKDEVGLDEDAINSDLDDPEEKDMDDEDEDEGANTMLCMYDKVQRVKNKWKCVMKDGVITVDGKEYVFHKATGEYEW